MSDKVYLYPIWIRLWHLFNAVLCLFLIVTGISMQYASPQAPLVRFDWAVKIHNISGIILSASYLMFFFGNLFTRNGRNYLLPMAGAGKRLFRQGRYYAYGVFKKEEPPYPIGSKRKFNPLQQFTYSIIMYMAIPVLIITGWAMLFPEVIIENYLGLDGYKATDLLHVAAGTLVLVFLLIHLYFATMGKHPTDHYKAMITGYHEDETKDE